MAVCRRSNVKLEEKETVVDGAPEELRTWRKVGARPGMRIEMVKYGDGNFLEKT